MPTNLLHQLILPARQGWQCRREITLRLPAREDFHPTIVCAADEVPLGVPLVLPRQSLRYRERLARKLLDFELEELETTVQVEGGPSAERFVYLWRQGTERMKASTIIWLQGRVLVTVEFADLNRHFDRHLHLFEAWWQEVDWSTLQSVSASET